MLPGDGTQLDGLPCIPKGTVASTICCRQSRSLSEIRNVTGDGLVIAATQNARMELTVPFTLLLFRNNATDHDFRLTCWGPFFKPRMFQVVHFSHEFAYK